MGYDHKKEVVQFASLELLAFLRALHWFHWTAHWQVTGSYGNHLLFEKMYSQTKGEIDQLAEKCVAYFGVNSVNEHDQAKKMSAILKWVDDSDDPLHRALALEEKFQGYILATHEMIVGAKKMTIGFDNLIQGVADTHEQHLYLLRQATSTHKLGSRVASKYLEKKAIRGGVYVPTKELPVFINKVLKEHRYTKRDIEVLARDKVESFGYATSEGNRPYAIAINLGTGQSKSVLGDYTGVASDLKGTVSLRENMAIVTGEYGGRGSFARLYIHPTNMARLLPSNDVALGEDEKYALKYISIYNTGGRKEAFSQKGFGQYSAQHPLVKSLAEKEFVKVSGQAVRITTNGRNIAESIDKEMGEP